MSRIGKKIINVPEKTEVSLASGVLTVKGPLGELKREFKPEIEINIAGREISLKPKSTDGQGNALWGTYSSHISNMVQGVNTLFVKKLIIEGIGYKAEVKGETLAMALGFSHPVNVPIPKDLKVVTEKNTVTISGIDKESVGQFSAEIRALKKPEPYKGKGIRYENEVIKRKQGKKSA